MTVTTNALRAQRTILPESGEQAEIDAAWRDTIARRLDDLETGRVQATNPWDTLAKIRAKIAAYEDNAR